MVAFPGDPFDTVGLEIDAKSFVRVVIIEIEGRRPVEADPPRIGSFIAAPAAGANPSAQPAPDFNFGWKFHFGPCEAAQEPAFDDAGWRTVDLQYIRVYAVDRKGNVVPDYCGKVHIDLKGGGSLLSLDNGDHYTNELSLGVTDKAMKDGFIMAVLRSSRTPGPVTVSFSSGRIQKTVTLECR